MLLAFLSAATNTEIWKTEKDMELTARKQRIEENEDNLSSRRDWWTPNILR